MPRPKPESGASTDDRETPADPAAVAELVAAGRMLFPDRLDEASELQLARRVSAIRRQRLLRFIAGAIADDILRGHGLSDRKQIDVESQDRLDETASGGDLRPDEFSEAERPQS